jgi:Outer membrane protein beta-barrel domain
MKQFIFAFLICSTTTIVAQTKIALTGGLNLNTISWKDKDDINAVADTSDYTYSSKKGKQGFNLGLLVNFHTEENWYVETGLVVSKKGGQTSETTNLSPGNVAFKRTQFFSPTYLQVPLYLLYMPESNKKYKITAGIGGFFGFGVGGKYESSTNINNGATIKVNRTAKFGIALTDDFAKMDIGLGARVGFLMNDNIMFSLGYQRSVVNNAPKVKERDGRASHNVISFNLTKYIKR